MVGFLTNCGSAGGEEILLGLAIIGTAVTVTGTFSVPVNSVSESTDRQSVWYAPYFTHVEVAAGAGGTIRIGTNPGEVLDFLLGFFGVDMYGDDLHHHWL